MVATRLAAATLGKEQVMDKDLVIGGSKLEAEGQTEKVEGKVQNAVGGIKGMIRDA